ncbi:MAG: hypothetical protein WBE80_10390 [Methylocella sp.]
MAFLNISSLTSALVSAGTPILNIPNLVSSIAAGNVAAAVNAYLNVILSNSSNTAIIAAEVLKIEETPGLPASIMPLLSTLVLPGQTPLTVTQTVNAIQAILVA